MEENDDIRPEFAWNTHSYLNEYIRFADTKAELVIGWVSALIAVFVAAGYQRHFAFSVLGCVSLAGFGLLLASFAFAFWTILPRLWTTQTTGFIFWRGITAHKCKADFVAELKAASAERLGDEVYGHLFELSKVCDAKFKYVNLAIIFAFVGSVVSGLAYLWQTGGTTCGS